MGQSKTADLPDAREWEAHAAQRARAGAIDADRAAGPPSDVQPTAGAIHLARRALADAHRLRDGESIAALARAVEHLAQAVEELSARVPDPTR
jgi:hypothetical protein